MKQRCSWSDNSKIYQDYHDFEWGIPEYDDFKLFEKLILETQQSGLSFITILKKREDYRKLFDNFDFNKIAKYNEEKILDLFKNPKIIRHKLKILSIINNAKIFIKIINEFGSFSNYIWNFTNNKIIVNNSKKNEELENLSIKISKDMKKRRMKFIGPIVVYSYLEAIGIINNHQENCFKNQ